MRRKTVQIKVTDLITKTCTIVHLTLLVFIYEVFMVYLTTLIVATTYEGPQDRMIVG